MKYGKQNFPLVTSIELEYNFLEELAFETDNIISTDCKS